MGVVWGLIFLTEFLGGARLARLVDIARWFRPKARRKDSWDVDMCWPMSSPSSGGPYSPEGSDDFDHLGERRQVDLGYLAAQYASVPVWKSLADVASMAWSSTR